MPLLAQLPAGAGELLSLLLLLRHSRGEKPRLGLVLLCGSLCFGKENGYIPLPHWCLVTSRPLSLGNSGESRCQFPLSSRFPPPREVTKSLSLTRFLPCSFPLGEIPIEESEEISANNRGLSL